MAPSVRLTRRVAFSSGHRYWVHGLSDKENMRLFGKYASPFNHGHNYQLDVSVEGAVDPGTGMVINIKAIDDILRNTIVRQFDSKSINDEIEHFRNRPSSVENLISYIAECLSEPPLLPAEVRMTGLRLEETPTLYVEYEPGLDTTAMTLTRCYEFAASHRLHNSLLSDAENVELFGKCNNAAGHGHNYVLEVSVSGEPETRTGMLVNLEELDRIVHEVVVNRYDHKNLNVDIQEFEGQVPSSEIVALEIFNRLKRALPVKLERIRLHETARNIFEVRA